MNLRVKDLMTTGMYAALYFVHVAIGTLIAVILLHSGNMLYAPAFSALISGTVYFILIDKVKKFGAITLVGITMALFFLLSGHFALSFLPFLICGIVADYMAKLGKYKQKLTNMVSYIIFSFGNFGPILFMWLAKDAYVQRLVEKGKDMAYIQNVMVEFDVWHIALLVVCSVIGGLIGQYMLEKHFRKAGLLS
ncbi:MULTISPECIES: MptD family putative ECF transporter S component [unclassified Granulicatella]|uniref:MptD family putative ECF transporter S component n=1 Tax=unclassified Granulicatella TaxID=2630493 RepID=UPI0010733993|nr:MULTISPECIES: MptD family putative ECF transporter S component [unclassified Granulicatella]MBF0779868.1 MptD family putative ECF transporter S component [Granulicatella sp. 19428wC4_WM01]TFU96072.1 Trep_Strep domain-containing protein [Granulicatella sp. WM01]